MFIQQLLQIVCRINIYMYLSYRRNNIDIIGIIGRIVINERRRTTLFRYEIVIERNAHIVLRRYADKIVRGSRDDPLATPIIPIY